MLVAFPANEPANPGDTTESDELSAVHPFVATATSVLADLADAVEEGRAPAKLPSVVASEAARVRAAGVPPLVLARLDRLARQIRQLHDAVARWTSASAADPAS